MNERMSTNADSLHAAHSRLEDLIYHYGKSRRLAHDEMLASGDEHLIKDHWVSLMQSLSRSEASQLEHKSHEARRIMRESGVTYNVYDEPEGSTRAWQLDPVPMLMAEDDWSGIEEGLIQRARLLNLIFKDIYGAQRLIRERLLPPEVIFAHQGFQRLCVGLYQKTEFSIFNYAADLARGPDGRMWVFSDRTQAPSGSGYALESRIAMSRVMPEEFRENKVRRLSHYFRNMRSALADLSANGRSDPLVVLLTPGPLNETYFEHAYLSSYLGYTLVQGADLTVREGKVWLKSIDGLTQVDIILRRVDDSFCDPLELREDSHLGVPGLLQAVRDGTVKVVNPLGSSIIESPAMYPFLANISKRWLGEDLKMPCAASWWCGQQKERDYVLDNLDKLVIKAIDRRFRSVFGGSLSRQEQETLREQIQATPYLYVGQERLACSTTPTLVEGGIEPRRVLFRSFLVACDGSYSVMPGGLTRIAPDHDSFVITNQSGGVNKDTWVLTDQPDRQTSLLPDTQKVLLKRDVEILMPSRSAENLYWVGRYAERAESVVRLMRIVLRKLADVSEYHDETDQACLRKILQALTHLSETYPGFVKPRSEELFTRPEDEILNVAFDQTKAGSMVSTLNALFYGAFNVRDLWSADTWRTLDNIGEFLHSVRSQKPSFYGLYNTIDEVVDTLMAFAGLTQESMSHESGWFLFDLGKRLERALQVIKMCRCLLTEADTQLDEQLQIEALMSAQESIITYRRRYRLAGSAEAACALLIFDEFHPRSIAFQIVKLQEHCRYLPRQVKSLFNQHLNDEEKTLLQCLTTLRLADIHTLCRVDEKTGRRTHLLNLLSEIESRLLSVSEDITHRYFAHTDYGRQLAPQMVIEEQP